MRMLADAVAEPVHRGCPQSRRALGQTFVVDDVERGQRCTGGHRVLFVGVVADCEIARHVEIGAGEDGGDGKGPTAERLAETDDIRSYVVISSMMRSVPWALALAATSCQ